MEEKKQSCLRGVLGKCRGTVRLLSLSAGMLGLLASTTFSAQAPEPAAGAPILKPPIEYAAHRLRTEGISEEFISLLKRTHVADQRDTIVNANVLGFLGKADYSGHFSARAVRECRAFLAKHRTQLARAEVASGVPREVIAALLWVETKHGKLQGRHPVGHVYFSLLQADHPEVLRSTLAEAGGRAPASASGEPGAEEEIRRKVIERSASKASWALEQLKSLERLPGGPPRAIGELKGSYAGAFGIPQFIPSSYLQWARTSRKGASPDLKRMPDAIESVAFYLKSNGWRPDDPESHRAALLHYNRAQGYVDVILKLASGARQPRPVRAKS